MYGNVIAFAGRITDEGRKQPKYINSRETELFSKGKVLYGLNFAKQSIIKEDKCIIVEGYCDVMRLHQLGFENTVATCGTALTKDQISLIQRFTRNVVLMYDGDQAGQEASRRNAELLFAEGMDVHFAQIPDGEDPDLFGQVYGKNTIKASIDGALNIVTFIASPVPVRSSTPEQIASDLKEIQQFLSLILDPAIRQIYVDYTSHMLNIPMDDINRGIRNIAVTKTNSIASGWQALNISKDAITEKGCCHIVSKFDDLIEAHTSGEAENTISFAGDIEQLPISELLEVTSKVVIAEQFFDEDCKERAIAALARRLIQSGFEVMSVCAGESQNFIIAYARECAKQMKDAPDTDGLRKASINNCAEMLRNSDETTSVMYTKAVAEALGMKISDLKKIAKKTSTEKAKHGKGAIVSQVMETTENVPAADKEFASKWGFFPRYDENGKKIGYVFCEKNRNRESEEEEMYTDVANFFIEPLFHVYDQDSAKNKRVVRVTSAEYDDAYIEFPSEAMIDISAFRKKIFNEGGYVFSGGNPYRLEKIIASIANGFPRCYTINIFGYQPENFYAFANAIYSNDEIKYVDELGLVEHNGKTYYLPAFNKINNGSPGGEDEYENDRLFVYKDNDETSFEVWAKLIVDVYKHNNNGMWALLFAIMSAFRSIIYPIGRYFTAPFFIGPTGCGKTQIALSIRSLFITPDAPSFNLNSGTNAAFHTSMKRYRDVAMIFEEYNNTHISDEKFQGLKAAVHDGDGKQKRKNVNSTDLDICKVNCSIILLGQESPERDDGALTNRVIVLPVPKKDDWTDEERNLLEELKRCEKAGLSNILIEILRHRDVVVELYHQLLRQYQKVLECDFVKSGDKYLTRLLNTVSLFLAMCKLIENHMPGLKLPFTFQEFYEIAVEKIISQSNSIDATSRLGHFFNTLGLLLNKRDGIINGRDFKIKSKSAITLQDGRGQSCLHKFDSSTKLIYLRINSLHPMYEGVLRNETLNLDSLRLFLYNHEAYIGQVQSTRFKWTDIVDEVDSLDEVKRVGKPAEQNTSAIVMDYEKLKKSFGVDFEKYNEDEIQL